MVRSARSRPCYLVIAQLLLMLGASLSCGGGGGPQVPNPFPEAQLSLTPSAPEPGGVVSLDASGTTTPWVATESDYSCSINVLDNGVPRQRAWAGASHSYPIVSSGPLAAGAYRAFVTVSDSSGDNQNTSTAAVDFVVSTCGPLPTIIDPPPSSLGGDLPRLRLPNLVQGEPYAATIPVQGGVAPVALHAVRALPSGLSLSGNTLQGTMPVDPSLTQNYELTVQVRCTDSCPVAARSTDALLEIQIRPAGSTQCNALVLPAVANLTPGFVGEVYAYEFGNVGGEGPYTFALDAATPGPLPPGLTFTSTGISGTPSAAGSYDFLVKVTDSCLSGAQSTSRLYTIVTSCEPLAFPQDSVLPAAQHLFSVDVTLLPTGGAPPVSIDLAPGSNPLPQGLVLTDGRLHGSPGAVGDFTFTVRATDSCPGTPQTLDKQFSLHVDCSDLALSPTLQPSIATLGRSFDTQVQFQQNGEWPTTLSVAGGQLPPGLTLNGNDISGTPSVLGSFTFTLQAQDSCPLGPQVAQQAYTIQVEPATGCDLTCPPMVFPAETIHTAYVGRPFTYQFYAGERTGTSVIELTGGSLPPGLAVAGTGYNNDFRVTGTPTTSGDYTFTLRAYAVCDGAGNVDKFRYFTIHVEQPSVGSPLLFNMGRLKNGPVGDFYSSSFLSSGGTGPYSYSVVGGALPPGLSIVGSELTGIPTAVGEYVPVIQVTDSSTPPQTSTRSFYIRVDIGAQCPPMVIHSEPWDGIVDQPFAPYTLVTGGSGDVTITETIPGRMPPGMSIVNNQLVGTPTAAGLYRVDLAFCDQCSAQPTHFEELEFQIQPASDPCPNSIGIAAGTGVGLVGDFFTFAVPTQGAIGPVTFSLGNGSVLPSGLTLSTDGIISGVPETERALGALNLQIVDSCPGGARTRTGYIFFGVAR